MAEMYGAFKEVGTVMRVPKRKTKLQLDDRGMREYTQLQCPHCNDIVELTTKGLRNNKALVVRQHIEVCVGWTGERPNKRARPTERVAGASADALVVYDNCPIDSTFNSSSDSGADSGADSSIEAGDQANGSIYELVRSETHTAGLEALRSRVERLERENSAIKAKTGLYDRVLYAVCPSIKLPLQAPEEVAQLTLRQAMVESMTSQMTTSFSNKMYEEHVAIKSEAVKIKEQEVHFKNEIIEHLKSRLDAKDTELQEARRKRKLAEETLTKAQVCAKHASAQAEMLKQERDELLSKYDAEVKAKAQLVQKYAKSNHSMHSIRETDSYQKTWKVRV